MVQVNVCFTEVVTFLGVVEGIPEIDYQLFAKHDKGASTTDMILPLFDHQQ
jgi:hypothetical protein